MRTYLSVGEELADVDGLSVPRFPRYRRFRSAVHLQSPSLFWRPWATCPLLKWLAAHYVMGRYTHLYKTLWNTKENINTTGMTVYRQKVLTRQNMKW